MDNPKTQKDERNLQNVQHEARRTYCMPELKHFGTIPAITGGPAGGALDGLTGGTGGFQGATS